MKVTFDERDHSYHDESGRVVPGVTNILTATGVCPPYFGPESAGRRGRWVHRATELVDQNALDWEAAAEKAPDWIGYVKAYQKFLGENSVEVLASEEVVCNEDWWYAGTLDRRLVVNGKRGVWDFKTSRAAASWHLVQATAYRRTFPATDRYVVRVLYFGSDGHYRIGGNDRVEEIAEQTWLDTHRKWMEANPWSRPD